MKRRLHLVSLLMALATNALAATPACQFSTEASGTQKIGPWINKSNWLNIENQRLSLHSSTTFMPSLRLPGGGTALAEAPRALPLDALETTDPLDGSRHDLAFMLDSRLYSDGMVVLRNGRIVAERYRNGLRADAPRPLFQATRPLLNLLGAISVAQGKLAADKSVNRFIPALNSPAGLRKISIQRLLEGDEHHTWSADEVASWRQAGGWTTTQPTSGIRHWLAQPGLWDRPLATQESPAVTSGPDDDLLAWALSESNGMPLSRLFCEQLLSRGQPQHPVHWLSDAQNIELADGLSMSLRDFAQLGQMLIETRSSRTRSRIPAWFIETLTASSGMRSPDIKGLARGSEQRYGFVHLGGKPARVALIGANGSSLYINFDKRLIVALYATYPGSNTPALLATLEKVWNTIDQASTP